MMIEAVLIFGLLSALFEAIILWKIPPAKRLRMFGRPNVVALVHAIVITFNLVVHFGTITGTMSAIVAGIASFMVVPLMKKRDGYIARTRMPTGYYEMRYFPGTKRYPREEIA